MGRGVGGFIELLLHATISNSVYFLFLFTFIFFLVGVVCLHATEFR